MVKGNVVQIINIILKVRNTETAKYCLQDI